MTGHLLIQASGVLQRGLYRFTRQIILSPLQNIKAATHRGPGTPTSFSWTTVQLPNEVRRKFNYIGKDNWNGTNGEKLFKGKMERFLQVDPVPRNGEMGG